MTPEEVAEKLRQFREALDALHDALPSRSHEHGKVEAILLDRELDDKLDSIEITLAELSGPPGPLFVDYSTWTGKVSDWAA
jgi:hypothetical protein